MFFWLNNVTRWTDETAEDPEAQLLGRINESPWHVTHVDKSTSIDNKATKLVFMQYFQEGVHNKMLCALLLPAILLFQLQNYSSH